MIKNIYTIFSKTINSFNQDGCFYMSAAISYYALLSIMPLLFMIISIFGFILGKSGELFNIIILNVKNFIPYLGDEFIDNLRTIVRHKTTIGWVSAIVFLWTASFVFSSISYALDKVFKNEKKRGVLFPTLKSLLLVLCVTIGLLVSLTLPPFLRILEAKNLQILTNYTYYLPIRSFFLRYLIPEILLVVIFTSIIKFFPVSQPRIKYSLYGGILCSFLWEIARMFFGWYITNIASYNLIYGSLGTMVITIVWIYYSSCILLLSAELAWVLESRNPPSKLTT